MPSEDDERLGGWRLANMARVFARRNALNATGDAIAVFSFSRGSTVEVSPSIGTQLEVFDAITYFARDAGFDLH
ncbi:MAG: hypothetical protein C5B56_12270 [Proteobacteria bacterium]|nr:MAG: hypothetical protein C5B56_12270 [Pseudomonadota bacterium]